jgi:7,8-dihydropterin-6-yl-methyl-4-(beta-D-ribofuranosyl)aminobenzene 5'-phosphate synthase
LDEAVVDLEPIDAVDVTILVDNYVDSHIPSTSIASQPVRPYDYFHADHQIRAEFGYSAFIRVTAGERQLTLLYDAGMGRDTLLNNAAAIGVSLQDIQTIVISHGHADHHGGLEGLVRRLGSGTPVVLHPHAFRERKIVYPSGAELRHVPPDRRSLRAHGVELLVETGAMMLIDQHVLATGRIPRRNNFELGYPWHQSKIRGAWQPDPWIWDDQALVMHLRGRGLVVLTGCGHAGVINTVQYARRLTGVHDVALISGGMHLTGGAFDDRIARTVAELMAVSPTLVAPGHCTGWKATHLLRQSLGQQFVQTSVGMTLGLTGASQQSQTATAQ